MLTDKSKPKVSTMRLRLRPSPSCLRRNHFHHPGAIYELIENPEQRLTAFHHDPLALAIGHGADHAFAQICPERSSVGRFYRHCPNVETREAAIAMSIPCARHSSKPPGACAWSAGVARHDCPILQTNLRPASIRRRSGNWGSAAPATDAGVPRCSHKTYEARELGNYLWPVPLHEQSPPVSTPLRTCRDER